MYQVSWIPDEPHFETVERTYKTIVDLRGYVRFDRDAKTFPHTERYELDITKEYAEEVGVSWSGVLVIQEVEEAKPIKPKTKIFQHVSNEWYRQATIKSDKGIIENAFVPLLQGDMPDHFYLLSGTNEDALSPDGSWVLYKKECKVLTPYDPSIIQWFCNQVQERLFETPESATYANLVIDVARNVFPNRLKNDYYSIHDIVQAHVTLQAIARERDDKAFEILSKASWESKANPKAKKNYRYTVTLVDHEGVRTQCSSWVHSMAIYGALAIYYLNSKS